MNPMNLHFKTRSNLFFSDLSSTTQVDINKERACKYNAVETLVKNEKKFEKKIRSLNLKDKSVGPF